MLPDGAASQNAAEQPRPLGIEPAIHLRSTSLLHRVLGEQALWVTVAVLLIVAYMSFREPYFASPENFYNISRNFAFIGITALGMTVVIISGGIDLSIGSAVGLTAVAAGVVLQAGLPWYVAILAALGSGVLVGGINGVLIAYVRLPPFVVTLGMMSAARSAAVILSGQRVVSNFGPDGPIFKAIGAGAFLGVSNPVWFLIVLTILLALVLRFTTWGRYVRAIGGNEQAARMTGIPVDRIKVQVYVVAALSAALVAILTIGWTGSAVNSLGTGYELRAIASTVIGGANLLGGEGGAFGALIGSVLLEIIRNGLLMAGVDSNWQGLLVGVFIVLSVSLDRIRGGKRG